MCPLGPRAKNVTVPPTGASPEAGSAAVFSHSALSVPRQATVSVVPVMTAAGPPVHGIEAAPSRAQLVLSDRMYSCLLVLVAMNSGCAGVTPLGLGGAATAGGAASVPPSECQPPPSCGACTHSCAWGPSTPTAGAVTCQVNDTEAGSTAAELDGVTVTW